MKLLLITTTFFLSFLFSFLLSLSAFAFENSPEVLNEENLNTLKYDGYLDESDLSVQKKIQAPIRILNIKQVHDEILKKKEPETTATEKQSNNSGNAN